jgi:hypothetical protein
LSRKNISLAGRLITSQDPLLIDGGQGDGPANFRQLTNMRYKDKNPQGVAGHTKINSSALATYLKARSGFHFKKDFPAESHVVIQAENTGETESKIWQNTAAIPGTGNFSLNHSSVGHTSDAIHTDDASAGLGRFSDAPQGFLAYCNGAESMVWGGDEARVASFIRFDPDDNKKKWDYTDQVANNLTTDVATLAKSGSSVDAETVTLLHFDDNLTDTTSSHTWDDGATMTYLSGKFSNAGSFDGTTDYILCDDADLSDFDFSSGIFTIDFWLYGNSDTDTQTVYYQEGADNNNYTRIYTTRVAGNYKVVFKIAKTAGTQIILTSESIGNSTWHHIAVVGDGTDCYLFINGEIVDSGTPTSFPDDLGDGADHAIFVGYDSNTFLDFLNARIDEFRVTNGKARWTSAFTPSTEAYPVESTEVYLGSILPIQGATFTVETANDQTSTAAAKYWDGSTWASVSSIADTTVTSGKTLAKDGTISFTDTSSTAKPRSIDNQFLYWYLFSFPDLNNATTVSHVTVDIAFQDIKDIWDGTYRTTLMAIEWDDSKASYADHTIGVFEDRYDSSDTSSFATLNSSPWVAADDFLIFGFVERQTGMVFDLVSSYENTVTAAMAVEYWEGDDWVSVGTLQDNTVQDGKTLGKSGTVTWNAPTLGSEFKRQDLGTRRKAPLGKWVPGTPAYESESGGEGNPAVEARFVLSKEERRLSESIKKQPYAMAQLDYPMHVYKVSFNGAIDPTTTDGVQVYHVGGIPAQNDLKDYVFPSIHQNRLFLSNNTSQHKNEEICAAVGTVNVFNGVDATRFKYGGEEGLVAAETLTIQFRDYTSSVRAILKANETWVLFGSSRETWRKLQVSDSKGCVAPLTLQRLDVVVDGALVQVLIFQGSNGIHMFDGKNAIDIDGDIRDIFDDGTINSSEIDNSTSYYDPQKQEYHWFWASGSNTDLNKEYVFDVRKFKWFEIDRGTGARLQCGYTVQDTSGSTYNYGMIDTGHAVRTENGTTFATATGSVEIAHTMWLGDFVPDVGAETKLENVNLVGKAISETDTVTMAHYGDGKTAASTPSVVAETQVASGKRIYDARMSVQKGGHYSHSLKFEVTTGTEVPGFEPLVLSMEYKKERDKGGR